MSTRGHPRSDRPLRCHYDSHRHRLSTVSRADVIYVLDHGRIVQSGSHLDLVAAGALYRDMWLQQVNGEGESHPEP